MLLLPWIELPLKSLAGKEGGERERKKAYPKFQGALRSF
jgi:hypothetical protein